jgi:hypothetical protein
MTAYDKYPNLRLAALTAVTLLTASAFCGCGKLDDQVNAARDNIVAALKTQDIYERNNVPTDPAPREIKGYYDIIGGAYRWVVNEARENQSDEFTVRRGDSIAFMFDARVFTARGNFESYRTFYTNIKSRIDQLVGNNTHFDPQFWPTAPLKIKVGDDPGILKPLQEALISCRAGDGDPTNDSQPGGIASDQVRVYLTPDMAFGNRTVYSVPAGSTIVFEIREIEIIGN